MPDVAFAILAKAPIASYVKTRLIPLLGPQGAARLQQRLIEHALEVATAAAIGPVTLWCAPDCAHAFFQDAARRHSIALARQPEGDLGERMLAAFAAAPPGQGLVVIGSDCPTLTGADLLAAAAALADADVVIAPAEDGGYGLIAARAAHPELFAAMPWGSERVAALTRERARAAGLHLAELRTVWDVDTPADVARLEASGLIDVAACR